MKKVLNYRLLHTKLLMSEIKAGKLTHKYNYPNVRSIIFLQKDDEVTISLFGDYNISICFSILKKKITEKLVKELNDYLGGEVDGEQFKKYKRD